MKRVLLFGHGPLLDGEQHVRSAGVLRTLQFLNALRSSLGKYHITKFLIGADNEEGYWEDPETFIISRNAPSLFKAARRIAREKKPELAIGVNIFPSFAAARVLPKDVPLWADLNGWIMAEMEAQSAELGHDDYLPRGWEQEQTVLNRASRISTVSTPQLYAVAGELAALGKINSSSFGKEFLHVIPNVASPERNVTGDSLRHSFLKGASVPEDAFLLVQIGGFNNWVDEKTLFEGVCAAMKQNDRIHFASTGGDLPGIAESPFRRFRERIAHSPFSERFHLLGWISGEEISSLYREGDLGIMVDRQCLETRTGARNRLNEMMARGLPILATAGSEITADIARWECGHIVESGKSDAVTEGILFLERHPEIRRTYSEKARPVCDTILTPENTLAPLLHWMTMADRRETHFWKKIPLDQRMGNHFHGAYHFWRERGTKEFLKKLLQMMKS